MLNKINGSRIIYFNLCLSGVWKSTRTHAHTHARTHTHTFNGSFSGTTQVNRYQKGKTNLDFTEARDSELQWHQLGHTRLHLAPDR